MSTSMSQTLGVDISKENLDVPLHPTGAHRRFANHREGFTALLKAQVAERLKQVERQIAALDAALPQRREADRILKARFDTLTSIPGLGEATALALLIDMPELGALENKCAASLAGLAPLARDRGQWRGKHFIRGGRAGLRHALFMPALIAVRCNPDSRPPPMPSSLPANPPSSLSSPSSAGSSSSPMLPSERRPPGSQKLLEKDRYSRGRA